MDAPVQDSVEFEHFADDLELLIPMLIPGVQLVRDSASVFVTRGRSDVEVRRTSWADCGIVLRFDAVRVLTASVHLVPTAISDLRADIIGFLCGAPLRSFSIWPQSGPKAELTSRRARRPHARLTSWWSRSHRDLLR
ncbi:MAG TPA: hypothetical protein VHT53_01030 [Candidatus Elarobacter sp.]|jgi:hypothetical protein|nr:hypothetical protein [Candidatus Elarobacter sp.]